MVSTRKNILFLDTIGSWLPPLKRVAELSGWKVATSSAFVNQDVLATADVVYCMWADNTAAWVTGRAIPGKVVVHLRAYEAYNGMFTKVDWSNVDRLAYSAQHVLDYVKPGLPEKIYDEAVHVPTGVDVDKFPLKADLSPGNRVAMVGSIAPPKGVPLFVQAAYEFPEYEWHAMGPLVERRTHSYLIYHLQKLPNLHYHPPGQGGEWFEGHGVNDFLESCHYIASFSYQESTHVALLEGMSKGLVPLVVDRPGAVFDDATFTTMSELEDLLEIRCPAAFYRDWIIENRLESRTTSAFMDVLESLRI
jgi:glycosyltransferase involved in cell wall biosynthesis